MEMITKAQRNAGDMRELAAQLQQALGPSWVRMVVWLRQNNRLGDVQQRIETGDYTGALNGITEAARMFASDAGSAQILSAQHASDWMTREVDRLVSFDQTNTRAVQSIAQTRGSLIRAITEDQRAAVEGALRDGIEAGDNPRVIARDVRMTIGLTDSQRMVVRNLRVELENGRYQAAMNRQLLDGQSERTLARMARDGGMLDQQQIDRIVDRYHTNMVAWRAETVARTEGLRAAHMGHQAAFQQAVDEGTVAPGSLVQRWNHKKIGRHWRRDHAKMHGQERPFGEPFISGSGAQLMYPLDPNAPPEETINCHCVVSTRYIRKR